MRVVALQVNPGRHLAMESRTAVQATDRGIEGDVHAGRRGKRQVLLVDATDLEAVGLRPGDLREQVTVDLPGLMALPAGTSLAVGDAEV
ncbi:MAG TPA: MOSC domain-containing protein, partial [Actinomycetota bacterium]|nr:MOSC domain-containing protein [Actinomycetota bacterium]